MKYIYPFFISFILVFFAELGDKTQVLVLSFSTKDRAKNILLGVAIGTFFSHGLAILFGSNLASLQNESFRFYSQVFTYLTFLLFGIIGFLPKKEINIENNSKSSILQKITSSKLNYMLIIAISIIIGELGDKTFLASLGLSLEYPKYKLSLILGSILGMVSSNSIALFFGKILGNKLNPKFIEFLSNLLFIIFGIFGFTNLFFNFF